MKRVFLTFAFMVITCVMLANHWAPIGGTQYNMTMSGIILIDGVEQTGTNLEVGAFCGDECRGSMRPEFFPPSSQYVVALTVVSNVQSGEAITFRLFDHSTNQELDLVSVNDITFNNNDIIGTLGDWFEFSFLTPSSTVTYTLPITGYESTPPVDYYLIAPPFNGINPAEIEGMTNGNYDLYYFEQNPVDGLEWINYKPNGAFNLESGKGYLYAHDTDVTLSFTGEPYSGDGKVTLRKVGGQGFEGWNLVGNPYGGSIVTIDRDCYVLKADGSEIIESDSRTINPMQGIFVIATRDGEEMTFTPNGNGDTGSKIALNLVRNDRNASFIDRAAIRFEGGESLPKFMLDTTNTKIYISQNGTDYSVVRQSDEISMPVNFKAKESGSYTINVEITNLNLDYLHLIDNKTGADIDLLRIPNYTFDASSEDYAERFNLVFFTAINLDESSFAFFNGTTWNVNIEGKADIQVIDMKGRIVCTETIGDNTEININQPAGVYILRLIKGNEVMVQKVVIK